MPLAHAIDPSTSIMYNIDLRFSPDEDKPYLPNIGEDYVIEKAEYSPYWVIKYKYFSQEEVIAYATNQNT